MLNQLVINGEVTPITSDLAVRWHDTPNGESIPVLYRKGKRVTKEWKLTYTCTSPEDLDGANANTD